MSIFSGPGVEGSQSGRRRSDSQSLSIVAPDMTVTGDLKADGVVRIEGRVSGNVEAGVQILLAPGGTVEGDLKTREAVIGGEVRGSVTGEERIELQPSAVIHGDLITPRLLIQEGGRITGAIRMEVPEAGA